MSNSSARLIALSGYRICGRSCYSLLVGMTIGASLLSAPYAVAAAPPGFNAQTQTLDIEKTFEAGNKLLEEKHYAEALVQYDRILVAEPDARGPLWNGGIAASLTVLATLLPVLLGVAAAVCFHRRFPLRGLARTIFIMPMMATPVAVALVWTMMFHPQLGVLNYLLTSVGLPGSAWSYDAATVIPTLVMVETWQWTPLVMLIVLGGLASLPQDPYEAARLDGASAWQMFRHISLPLVWPHIVVALVIRTIDALKAFDLIFVISNGGPGTSSETLNLYLYLQAFAFYDMGYASALVVVFFVIILAISLVLFGLRKPAH